MSVLKQSIESIAAKKAEVKQTTLEMQELREHNRILRGSIRETENQAKLDVLQSGLGDMYSYGLPQYNDLQSLVSNLTRLHPRLKDTKEYRRYHEDLLTFNQALELLSESKNKLIQLIANVAEASDLVEVRVNFEKAAKRL